MKQMLVMILICLAAPLRAHPHIFVDVGFEVIADADGRAESIEVTWAYDALYSLLITEDYGLDQDGDAVLTLEEEAALAGFDMRWIDGFNGDVVMRVDETEVALSLPRDFTAKMREGRIVTTHIRDIENLPKLTGKLLSIKPFDPTFYTAYDVAMGVKVSGVDGCMIDKQEPDLDAEMTALQDELAKLGSDQDSIEMGFPEVGEAFATEVRITCAGF